MIEPYDHDDYVGDDDEIEPIYNMHSLSSQSKGNSRVKAEKCTALQGELRYEWVHHIALRTPAPQDSGVLLMTRCSVVLARSIPVCIV